MHWIWRNLIISTVIGLFVFVFLYYSETGITPDIAVHLVPLATALVLFNGVGIGLHYLGRRLDAFIPWNKAITARFLLEIAAGLILLLIGSLVFSLLFLDMAGGAEGGAAFWHQNRDGAIKFGILSLVIVFVYAMVNLSIFSYNQYSRFQVARVRLERQQLNLQFEALRSQLSPHFLFNALNTISSLIYRDIGLAEDFIRRMAHSYRYILATNDRKLVSLQSELDMLKAYFFMQKIKYESCIDLVAELPEPVMGSVIPPLTLQMLLENAMKHNLICEDRKLVVTLSAQDGYLLVANNIIPKTELLKIGNSLLNRPREEGSHKIGLSNIRNRYSFFTQKKVEVILNKDFTVKLPILHTSEQDNLL